MTTSPLCRVFKYGQGPNVMLGFHGIGQDHRAFMSLVSSLPQYTFYLFDLPFHGQSPALPKEYLTLNQWQHYLEDFLQQHHISSFGVIGFSMGGKFALATLQLFASRIQSCWLLAPDGVTVSPWYRVATHYWFSKCLFKWFVLNIERFDVLSHFFVCLKLVNKSAVRFAKSTLSTPTRRAQVYNAWVGFSKIEVDMTEIAVLVQKYSVKLMIFLGKYDAMLPANYVRPLTQRLPQLRPIILQTGHHKLIEKVAEWLEKEKSY